MCFSTSTANTIEKWGTPAYSSCGVVEHQLIAVLITDVILPASLALVEVPKYMSESAESAVKKNLIIPGLRHCTILSREHTWLQHLACWRLSRQRESNTCHIGVSCRPVWSLATHLSRVILTSSSSLYSSWRRVLLIWQSRPALVRCLVPYKIAQIRNCRHL